MNVLDAIYARQSVGSVKPDPVARELIEKLLEAAAQAPNHHRVRPWRFIVFTGQGREQLAQALIDTLTQKNPESPAEALTAERMKVQRAPVIIAVGVDKPSGPKISEIENICAAASAIENLLLAAQSLGLATIWRTGPAVHDLNVKALCRLAPDQALIGLVYLGYPVQEAAPVTRPGAEDRTLWIDG